MQIKTQKQGEVDINNMKPPVTLFAYDHIKDKFLFETFQDSNYNIKIDPITRKRSRNLKKKKDQAYKLTFSTGKSAGTNIELIIGESANMLTYSPTVEELMSRHNTKPSLEEMKMKFSDINNYKKTSVKDLEVSDFVMRYVNYNTRASHVSAKLIDIKKMEDDVDSYEFTSDNYYIINHFLISYKG